MESEQDSTAGEWESELDEAFLDQVSAEEVVGLINTNLRPACPFQVTAHRGEDQQSVTTLQGKLGDTFSLTLSIDGADKITGLIFGPATDPEWTEPASLEEVRQRLEDFPGQVSALVIKDDKTLIDINRDEEMPLASAFKLYVLLAVAEQVQAGNLTWDEELTVTDGVRSLPSGELQDAPEGAKVSVREAALKMLSISDNTTTDMLINRVGRKAVEDAVVHSGHSNPSLLHPFPTTRELFSLGWADNGYAQQWADGDEAARRALLEEIDSQPFTVAVSAVSGGAVWPQGIDWFATSKDVTSAQRALFDLDDAQIRTVLSANPGVNADGWDYAAFKGGSSLGVLTGSWLLQSDATVATIVFLARSDDPAELAAAQQELFGLAESTIALLAE